MSDLESYVTSIYGTKPKRGKRKESIDIKYDKEKVVTDEETSFKRPKIEADTADSKTGGPNLEKKNLELESLNGTWKSIDPNNSVTMPIKRGGLRDSSEIDAELNLKEKKRLEELARLAQENNLKKHEKIYRDKTGRKLTEAEVQLLEKKQQKHQHRDSYDESEPKLDQKTIADAKYKEKRLKQIKNENLNIYTNDPTLIASQKSEIKSEDPALLFDKKLINEHKNATQQKLLSSTGRKLYLHENEYPYNRFGVKPGWRWDGIVRGNGYEKKLLNDLINKKDSN